MDIAQRPFGVGVQRLGVRVLPSNVGLDGRNKPRLAQLPKDRAAKAQVVQRGRAQRDQRFAPRRSKALAVRPGDPLGQHRQCPTRLLVLRQRLPLPLEYRKCGWMEGVAGLESATQIIPRFCLSRGRVHGRPLRWKLRPPFKAPVGKSFRYLFSYAFVS
ncbi:hypothetical protein HRbin18_00001 [bacterium HR18]|nr:hypothetical protein HRbin18_00001 [bacterium HR18]